MKASSFLDYWMAALAEPAGIYIRTSDPNRLKSLLYSARARSNDPSILHLQIRTSPADPKGEVFIFNPHALEG